MGRDISPGPVEIGQGVKVLNWEGRLRLDIRKTFFTKKVVTHWEQIAWGGGTCPMPGTIPGQVGWGSEQDYPLKITHYRSVGLDGL